MDRNILVPLRISFSIQFVIRSGVYARRLRSFIDWSTIGYLWTASLLPIIPSKSIWSAEINLQRVGNNKFENIPSADNRSSRDLKRTANLIDLCFF